VTVLGVAITTWIQLAGVAIAAVAALAAWAAVRNGTAQAREGREAAAEARLAQREARQPLLLLSPGFASPAPGAGGRTMTLAIYNAGDVAIDVGVLLVGDEARAQQVVGFMYPGETVHFGSDIPATGESRAMVFARSKDGDRWVWDHERVRKAISKETPRDDEWQAMTAAFYPGEDFGRLRPARLLREASLV
jgi:hypothetical protein